MDTTLTYGQLYDKLRELDFTQRKVEIDGKRQFLFEHPSSKAALLFLPVRDTTAIVEPFFLRSVQVLLKTHHLISPPDLLDVLTNGHGSTSVPPRT